MPWLFSPGSPHASAPAEWGRITCRELSSLPAQRWRLGCWHRHSERSRRPACPRPQPSSRHPPRSRRLLRRNPEQLPPPPPFPPMPSSRPSHRWVDIGNHHASRAHHRARAAHAPARRTHHRRAHASRTAHKARAAMHFSKKTIRSCHGMTYRQIMRHSNCRALMKQELAAPAHRHRTSHRAIHHKASANHKIARHHKATRRRR